MSTARRLDGPGFGHAGGSNLADYLSATERAHQIELEMEPGERLVEIPVDLIDCSPFQARATFDDEEIAALAEDIQEHGLNHPVTVREGTGGRYELVAGERRWLAAKQAGLPHVLARIRSLDDFAAHLISVGENNLRANLSPWEMSLEAARLLQHAKECDRPHTQRDLARYLNRNVSLVNHQLAIAATITPDLLERSSLSEASLCLLPHVTLRRIAKLPEARRGRALKEAIRLQQPRTSAAEPEAEASGAAASTPTDAASPDCWEQLWVKGGFRLQVRTPIRDLDPGRAVEYIQRVIPAIGGFAARAAESEGADPLIRWGSPHGELIFIRPLSQMSSEERTSACEALVTLLRSLAPSTETSVARFAPDDARQEGGRDAADPTI